MKTLQFTATEVSLQLEQGYHVLAFYNDDEYLFLQRLEEIGHKEDDGVYVEYKDPLHAGFDVVDQVKLSPKQFTLRLKSPLYKLPGVNEFIVDITITEQDCQRYGGLLQTLFADRLVDVQLNT